ncbi:hypothetical protein JOD03_000978 [Chryseomicrobium aureum]|uniref:hypothetical protein n=1 Tax=Chryseomicrobium aureum TaxID=1441723 RepID=UPI00195D4E8A|nr:hypothetical protein [Chryseomicrobium aureum]MBM7706076.1 hypothetical protein [Chryseomicrobium aureum]
MSKFIFSPLIKVSANIISTLIFGILCSALIAEITINGVLEWGAMLKSWLLYFMISFTILLITYNYFLYIHDRNLLEKSDAIERFKDKLFDEVGDSAVKFAVDRLDRGDLGGLTELSALIKDLEKKK